MIEYVDGQWLLKDGDGKKHSTNGTWLFVDELFLIYDGMVFNANVKRGYNLWKLSYISMRSL